MLTNAQIAELLARAAEEAEPGSNREKALGRDGRQTGRRGPDGRVQGEMRGSNPTRLAALWRSITNGGLPLGCSTAEMIDRFGYTITHAYHQVETTRVVRRSGP